LVWFVNGTGFKNSTLAPGNISFKLSNGTYILYITNLSSYYTASNTLTLQVKGGNVTESVSFKHWAYITGKVSPNDAGITINGKNVTIISGAFNLSVAQGTYNLTAHLVGYVSYYNNFTLSSGSVKNLTIDLKKVATKSSISSSDVYFIVGGVVAVIAIIMSFLYFRKR